jgi:hypothetical protein
MRWSAALELTIRQGAVGDWCQTPVTSWAEPSGRPPVEIHTGRPAAGDVACLRACGAARRGAASISEAWCFTPASKSGFKSGEISTRARELFDAGLLADTAGLRRVVDLPPELGPLAAALNEAAAGADGRTYAGGLTKFEPREMERIRVVAPI